MPYEKSSPSSPEAQSASPIQDNLRALATLFPSVVRDGQVDVDALRQLCGEAVVKEDELFGLNWRGKAEARRAALTPSLGTLRPCKEESKDWDTTQNLYIEGDNLEVLKLLRKSYGGKVKMIYIDPPYNTGKEFVYPDDYQNGIENYKKLTGQEGKFSANIETSGRYHTDWLNMMYPRLLLARDLLREDGVIYISIDDHELENLKRICDEIFGSQNFRNTLIVRRRVKCLNSQFADDGLASLNVGFEYILVYSKSNHFVMKALRQKKTNASQKGRWDVFWSNADRPTMRYDILGFTPETGQWRNSKEKAYNAVENYRVYETTYASSMELEEYSKHTGITDFIRRIPNATGKNGGVQHWVAPSDTALRTSNWTDIEVSQIGKEIELPFENPKSRQLVTELIKLSEFTNTDIILDFFSGSATTAHAVMKLNAEDRGDRRFIMVQLPELCDEKSEAYKAGYKNICEIGKERIRRAGEKVKEEAGLAGQNLDIGFRVYKLDSSNVKAWNPQAEDLATAVNNYAEHLVGGRTEDDFLTEIMLKSGIDLTEKIAEREIAGHRVQSLGYGQYYACMATDLADDAEDVALGIAAWHEEDCTFAGGEQQDTCTVFVADRAFESNDAAKMNFVAILEQHGICNIKAL